MASPLILNQFSDGCKKQDTSVVLTIQWRTFILLHELSTAFFTNSCNSYKIRVIIFCHITLNLTLANQNSFSAALFKIFFSSSDNKGYPF
jgi:hypothetical protein